MRIYRSNLLKYKSKFFKLLLYQLARIRRWKQHDQVRLLIEWKVVIIEFLKFKITHLIFLKNWYFLLIFNILQIIHKLVYILNAILFWEKGLAPGFGWLLQAWWCYQTIWNEMYWHLCYRWRMHLRL